eukprot:UN02544
MRFKVGLYDTHFAIIPKMIKIVYVIKEYIQIEAKALSQLSQFFHPTTGKYSDVSPTSHAAQSRSMTSNMLIRKLEHITTTTQPLRSSSQWKSRVHIKHMKELNKHCSSS